VPAAPLPPSEAQRLAALRSYDILDTAADPDIDRTTRLAARLSGCPIALVSLVDTERQWFKSRQGIAVTETPRALAFCAHAILEPSRLLLVPDAREDPRFRDNALVTGAPHIRFYAGTPLVNPDGHALGTLCVIDRQAHTFDADSVEVLIELGRAVMTRLELHRTTRSLRTVLQSAEQRLARVMEASPTAVALIGADGRIERVNSHTERVFGYGSGALHGRSVEDLVPVRFRSRHAGHRDQFRSRAGSRSMGAGPALWGLRHDGTEFPLEIALNPIELDGVSMVLAGIVDITARRQLEQERDQQRRDLARSNADLEEFAYVASHDLKAPLRGIAHLVGWITEDLEAGASPETLEHLALLRGRVTRLQMLQDGLLAYSRVGRVHSAIEPVDTAEVVRDVIVLLAPRPGFVIGCEGPMPVLRTRRSPFHIVMENLIGNALKHHDRAEGRIVVSARQLDDLTEFRVSDDGPGIASRFHERVFVIFQTLASRDDIEASGIGLAIVKKKVEGHGGTIRIESEPPERGTTFVFTWKESVA